MPPLVGGMESNMFDWDGDGKTDKLDYLYYKNYICDDKQEEDSDDDEDDEDDGGDDTADWQGSSNKTITDAIAISSVHAL